MTIDICARALQVPAEKQAQPSTPGSSMLNVVLGLELLLC